jgi:hypothetical protein
VSGVADRTRAAQYQFAIHGVPHFFGRERHVMRPFSLKIGAGDFALAAGHCCIAIGFVAGCWPPQILTRDDGRLNTVRW